MPALLLRTPYDRSRSLIPPRRSIPSAAVEAGFALVCQDVRGQYGSEGEFYPFVPRGRRRLRQRRVGRRAAVVERRGRHGRTLLRRRLPVARGGRAAAASARRSSPVVTGSDYYDGWIYQGGAFQLGFNLFWAQLMSGPARRARWSSVYRHLPLPPVPLPEPKWARLYRDWLAHPTDDDYWQSLSIDRRYERVQCRRSTSAAGTTSFSAGRSRTSADAAGGRLGGGARGAAAAVGPWAHGSTYGAYPDHGFDVFARRLARSDRDAARVLARPRGSGDDEPPVRIFVMGENRWRDEDDVAARPRAATRLVPPRRRDRSRERAAAERAARRVRLRSADPAPTVGGPTSLPARMMRDELRPARPAAGRGAAGRARLHLGAARAPLEVTGPLVVRLRRHDGAPDTDFVAKLCDVAPDGVSLILAEGVLRARFREGYDRARPGRAGRVSSDTIDLVATSERLPAPATGSASLVTSSSFPRFDRNPNTGRPTRRGRPETTCAPRARRSSTTAGAPRTSCCRSCLGSRARAALLLRAAE